MSARLPGRPDRFELISRALLGLALVAGVVWALGHGGGPATGFELPLH